MMRITWALIIALLFANVLLVACGNSEPIECSPVDTQPGTGETVIEQMRVDNSTGSSDIDQDMTVSKEFQHSLDLDLNSDSECDQRNVRNTIHDNYDLIDSTGQKVCILPVEVPAGSIYIYDIEWTTVVREGEVRQGASGAGDLEGTYSIVTDMQCQIVDVTIQ